MNIYPRIAFEKNLRFCGDLQHYPISNDMWCNVPFLISKGDLASFRLTPKATGHFLEIYKAFESEKNSLCNLTIDNLSTAHLFLLTKSLSNPNCKIERLRLSHLVSFDCLIDFLNFLATKKHPIRFLILEWIQSSRRKDRSKQKKELRTVLDKLFRNPESKLLGFRLIGQNMVTEYDLKESLFDPNCTLLYPDIAFFCDFDFELFLKKQKNKLSLIALASSKSRVGARSSTKDLPFDLLRYLKMFL